MCKNHYNKSFMKKFKFFHFSFKQYNNSYSKRTTFHNSFSLKEFKRRFENRMSTK